MRVSSIVTALAAAGLSTVATAADWEFNPRVEAGYLFDDNYRLTQPGTEIEVQGPLLDAALEMRAVTPSGEFSFTPRVRATYFPNERELDSQDYFGTLDWQHHGQRTNSRVLADFAEQDVVNSEQPDAEVPVGSNLGESDFGDAGRVLVKNRRTRISVRPSLDIDLTQRYQLQFDASYADVSFDQQISTAQVDYNNVDLTAGLMTRWSETSSLTARVRGARYDIATDGLSTSYGAELQWDTRSVADVQTFLRGGAQSVQLADGGSEVAWLAGAGVSMPVGRNELFADLSRSVGPSSAGVVVTRDQLRLRWTRAMTPRLSLLAGLRGTHDDDIDTTSTVQPRTYATGDIGLQWQWQEEFSVRAGYDYTWQQFENSGSDATSSGATVSILYQPLQRRR